MKNILLMTTFSLALVSCGNPHISSVTKDQPIRSPIVTDCLTTGGDEVLFFLTEDKAFKRITECGHRIDEDFRTVDVGQTNVVRHGDHEVTHHTENSIPDKVESIDLLFSDKTYPMSVENPLSLNGDKGTDKGLNSLDADSIEKDALLWTFDRPVSAFSMTMVGFRPNPGQEASLRIFDCNKMLIDEKKISDKTSFLGFVSPHENVCYVSLTAARASEALGVDDFRYYYR